MPRPEDGSATASKLVLASASRARTRMLLDAGIPHTCDPADLDEAKIKTAWSGSPNGLAEKLALEKALTVSPRHPGAWVVGSDQVLAFDGQVLDKPGNMDAARAQLLRLRGREHRLISAVVVVQDDKAAWSHVDTAVLAMRDFSDAFLDDYLDRAGQDVVASVGAYHLEGLGAQLFDHIDGDFFTILGLPLLPLLKAMRAQGAIFS